jgi:hypothetical protein
MLLYLFCRCGEPATAARAAFNTQAWFKRDVVDGRPCCARVSRKAITRPER